MYLFSEIFKTIAWTKDYAVFRAIEWRDIMLTPCTTGLLHDFAVVWDEDQDTRIIEAAEILYLEGLLAPVQYLYEHKGELTLLVAAPFNHYRKVFEKKVDTLLSKYFNKDYWTVAVGYIDKSDMLNGTDSTDHQTQLGDLDGYRETVIAVDKTYEIGLKRFKFSINDSPDNSFSEEPPRIEYEPYYPVKGYAINEIIVKLLAIEKEGMQK